MSHEVPLADARILTVLLYNPHLHDEEKASYLRRMQAEEVRRVAAVLMEVEVYQTARPEVREVVDRINQWRETEGIPIRARGPWPNRS